MTCSYIFTLERGGGKEAKGMNKCIIFTMFDLFINELEPGLSSEVVKDCGWH